MTETCVYVLNQRKCDFTEETRLFSFNELLFDLWDHSKEDIIEFKLFFTLYFPSHGLKHIIYSTFKSWNNNCILLSARSWCFRAAATQLEHHNLIIIMIQNFSLLEKKVRDFFRTSGGFHDRKTDRNWSRGKLQQYNATHEGICR